MDEKDEKQSELYIFEMNVLGGDAVKVSSVIRASPEHSSLEKPVMPMPSSLVVGRKTLSDETTRCQQPEQESARPLYGTDSF